MLEKTNIPGYLKDTKTHVVQNVNKVELQQCLIARRKVVELNNLNDKVDNMMIEMDHLKTLLVQLLEKAS